MLSETSLRDWYLVTFHDAPEPNQILWGTVQNDPSCRWNPGDWCCTSPVLETTDELVFITKNTRYTTVGPGEAVALPVKALVELRQGISPLEYRTLSDNPGLGLSFVRQALPSQEDNAAECFEPYNIQLTDEEYVRFMEALHNPPEPSGKLKQLRQSERMKEQTLLRGLTAETAHSDEAAQPTAKELGANNDENR